MEQRGTLNITTSKVASDVTGYGYVGQVFVDGVRVWESDPANERDEAKKLAENKVSNVFSKMFA